MSGPKINNVFPGMTPTLLSASKANQLIDAINSLQNIKIEYGPNFKAKYGANGVILTIPYPDGSGGLGSEELEMYVCINGEAVKRTFVLA
jgi:hypothetical protein